MFQESDYFTSEGNLVPGFHVIGKFKGKRAKDMSEAERIVVNHFFTNDDSNVYAATENMSAQLWALLMGQYARSAVTGRERLIQLFNDVHKKDKTGTAPSLEQIAGAIQDSKDISILLKKHLLNAGKFIETMGVKYGHASLRDSGVIGVCFEGVSQRATKHLESAREAAYQEQSTRAIPFTLENLGVPIEVKGTPFEQRFVKLGIMASQLYEKIHDSSKNYLNQEYAFLREEADKKIQKDSGVKDAKLSDKEWASVVEAKAFDIARSLLPQNMTTSLGMTINARRLQDQLTQWQSSEFEEMNILGRAAQIESMKLMPSLMKHGNPSEFYSKLPEKIRNLNDTYVVPGSNEFGHKELKTNLISHTSDLEDWVLSSILFNGSDSSNSLAEIKLQIEKLSPPERRDIAKSQFEGKKSYEIIPKTMEIGTVTFEREYDIGAFRDLQRQRGDRQQIAPYATFAYHMPKEVNNLEAGLSNEFHNVANEAKILYNDLKNSKMHSVAEYVPLMANLIRHIATKDPVQSFYEAKLRAQAAGADSYRQIAISEANQTLDLLPSFKGLVEFDNTQEYALNRLPEKVRMATEKAKKKSTT